MTLRTACWIGLAIGIALAAVIAATAWWTGANGAGGWYVAAGNAFTILFIWGWLGLMLLFATGDRRLRARQTARVAIAVSCLGLPAAPFAHKAGVEVATGRVAEAAAPVLAAIEAWEADRGTPPARLHYLVPEYLPALPDTTLDLGRLYTYERAATTEPLGERLWWDVGPAGPSSRDGVLDPSTGPNDRATFTALIGSAGRVESTRAWRIDRMTDAAPFDADAWATPGTARRGAALTIARDDRYAGLTEPELIDALGPPDGREPAPETTWALRVGMDLNVEFPGQHVYLEAASDPPWRRWSGAPPAVGRWFYLPR